MGLEITFRHTVLVEGFCVRLLEIVCLLSVTVVGSGDWSSRVTQETIMGPQASKSLVESHCSRPQEAVRLKDSTFSHLTLFFLIHFYCNV